MLPQLSLVQPEPIPLSGTQHIQGNSAWSCHTAHSSNIHVDCIQKEYSNDTSPGQTPFPDSLKNHSPNASSLTKEHVEANGDSTGNTNDSDNPFAFDSDNCIGSYAPLVCFTCLIAFGGFVFGYDIGTIGGLIDMTPFIQTYGDTMLGNGHKAFKPITKGTIVSISCLGGFLSGIIVNKMIPYMGMRFTVFVSMLCYIMGNTLTLFSPNWKVVVVGRIFNGLSIGISQITCPMYISEITPIKQRGIFTCFNQLFTTFGIVVGSTSLLFTATQYFPSDSAQYQYPICQGMVLAAIGGLGIWFVPESPNWLVKRNKSIKVVKKSLGSLRGLPITDENIINLTAKLFDMNTRPVKHEKVSTNIKNIDSKSIFKGKPKYFLRTLTGVFLLGFQQFTGINFFFYYGLLIFENVNLKTPYLVPVIFGLVNLVFSCLSVCVISIFKRKALLISGSVMLSILMALFTICGTVVKQNTNTTISLIILSCLFIAVFSLTWGPIASVIISELFPAPIKVKAMSICGSSAWIFNFAITLLVPLLANKIGLALGWVFAGFTALASLFVYQMIPETKNVTTTMLDKYYEENNSIFFHSSSLSRSWGKRGA